MPQNSFYLFSHSIIFLLRCRLILHFFPLTHVKFWIGSNPRLLPARFVCAVPVQPQKIWKVFYFSCLLLVTTFRLLHQPAVNLSLFISYCTHNYAVILNFGMAVITYSTNQELGSGIFTWQAQTSGVIPRVKPPSVVIGNTFTFGTPLDQSN